MRSWVMVSTSLAMLGCWSIERSPLGDGPTPYTPRATVSPGWIVSEHASPYVCPDGEVAPVWIIRPAELPEEPQAVAVIYHDGPFDYVVEPLIDDPMAGEHHRNPGRLNSSWAMRRAWMVAGMFKQDDTVAKHTGALPAAFAQRGVLTVLPINCWGDYWANSADNGSADLFERQGRGIAKWAWLLASKPGFAPEVDLGFTPDPSRLYAAGLAEGGRGVAVVLHDNSLVKPAGVIVDSVDDDMSVYWSGEEVWAEKLDGLQRIWPQGEAQAMASRLAAAPLPARTVLLYSNTDVGLPAGSVDELSLRIQDMEGGKVIATTVTGHIQIAGDEVIAAEAVKHILGEAE